MKKNVTGLFIILFASIAGFAQSQSPLPVSANELYFVSDTQQPMLVERLVLKSNQNLKAMADLFASILKDRPPR